MVQFKSFELKNADLIFGGTLIPCTWSDGTNTGDDVIDTANMKVVYY